MKQTIDDLINAKHEVVNWETNPIANVSGGAWNEGFDGQLDGSNRYRTRANRADTNVDATPYEKCGRENFKYVR
jgi:hypothetical protein